MVDAAHNMVVNKTGAGNDFLGWIDLPGEYDKEEFARIKKAAEKIQNDSEVLLVIGIGGSYLGARAAIEFLRHSFYNNIPKDQRKTPEIYFVGNSISSTYLKHLIQVIGDRDFSINMISKSGTTTEPAIAFRVFRKMMEEKYGKEEAAKRIYVTTDKSRGALKALADSEGYKTFVVPDDVGGRYSVLTAVGLLPIAAAGIDIDALMLGAAEAREKLMPTFVEENDCYKYVAVRNALYNKGKATEMFISYEPCFTMMNEWLKQLFGESEGKQGKGLFPTSAVFSTDLHSLGQYIQEGERIMFETVLDIKTNLGSPFLLATTISFASLQSITIPVVFFKLARGINFIICFSFHIKSRQHNNQLLRYLLHIYFINISTVCALSQFRP